MKSELYDILAEMVLELSPKRIEVLAKAVEGCYNEEDVSDAILEARGPNYDKVLFGKLMDVIETMPDIKGSDLAIAFRAGLATAQHTGRFGQQELLWTGPSTATVPIRQTEQALIQVIQSAKKDLFIVSYVAYAVPSVVEALCDAQERNVVLNFLLEQSQEAGGKVTTDSIATLKKKLPAAHFHVWKQPNADKTAAVHAKCAVADGEVAMITSANLTGKAMNENMELGILINGGPVPKQLSDHLYALVTEKIIIEIK
jgi:phosphatidylserine/phosphatidylglycerophosphate/cardiolipin synthase-like enzyme